jgi:hypothetical protein
MSHYRPLSKPFSMGLEGIVNVLFEQALWEFVAYLQLGLHLPSFLPFVSLLTFPSSSFFHFVT